MARHCEVIYDDDGNPIARAQVDGELTDEGRAALIQVIEAAQRCFAKEHPEETADPQTASQGVAPVALAGAPTVAPSPAGGGGHPERAQVAAQDPVLPGAKTGDRPGVGLSPVQTSAALAVGGQASSRECLGKISRLLANLAERWDELALDQQGISDLFAGSDPQQSAIARGRSRQLTDCADELRALIAEKNGV